MEPEYHKIITHPMDMSQLDRNIKKKMYGSTEAFLADVKWILHNSVIYNGSKYLLPAFDRQLGIVVVTYSIPVMYLSLTSHVPTTCRVLVE